MRIRLNYPLNILEICKATDGTIIGNFNSNPSINYICTDTRECEAKDLFIALQGENDCGEKYINEAIKKGCYVMSTGPSSSGIHVNDTSDALINLAKYYKFKTEIKYTVAVTGSVGKSTTVKFLSRILAQRYKVHSPKGNFNNHIGVPITLLSTPKNSEILIAELGMNHKKEISRLSKCIRPDIGVITSIGSSHIGNLGSREAIANAKLEILDGIEKGIVLLPYSEALLKGVSNGLYVDLNSSVSDFSLNKLNDHHYEFTSIYGNLSYNSLIDLPKHLLIDLSFAISVAKILNMTDTEIINGIKMISDSDLRQRFIELNDFTIFDDSYNASLESIKADLVHISKFSRPLGAFLGDVLELGNNAVSIHEKIGREAAQYKLDHLYLYGEYANVIAKGAIGEGMDPDSIFINTNLSEPNTSIGHIRKYHFKNELILFKASHKLRLDIIADMIAKEERTNNDR